MLGTAAREMNTRVTARVHNTHLNSVLEMCPRQYGRRINHPRFRGVKRIRTTAEGSCLAPMMPSTRLLSARYPGQPDDRATRVGYVYYRQIAG